MSANTNKYMKMLSRMDGVVRDKRDVFANTIRFGSPSFNHLFGKKRGGMPYGYSAVFYGPPKGGKSVCSHLAIGQIHQEDPEAIVIKIDTEFRADGQLDDKSCALFGIDQSRLLVMQASSPVEVFDQIEKDVDAICEAGAPVKAIIIDSLNGLQGRREKELESIEKLTIGDHALTVGTGLKRIKPITFRRGIGLILIDQVRAEMDQLEIRRGNKMKMQSGWAVQHLAEYFVFIEENRNKDGRQDLLKRDLTTAGVKDVKNKEQKTALKIKATMVKSTMAGYTNGRTAELTFDFHKGLINTHEETFLLGTNRGVIVRNGSRYEFDGKTWNGQAATLSALAADKALCTRIEDEVARRDDAGEYNDAAVNGEGGEGGDGFEMDDDDMGETA